MEKILELYKYVDGVNDTPFPNENNHVVITSFRYDAKRMGGSPVITCTAMSELCLDKLWDYNVYASFNGEMYFIKQIPTSSFDNTDSRYKHEIELVSERAILDNVYVYDVVDSESTQDKPVSNSSNFSFFGDISEFANRLNQSLKYSKVGYSVVVDAGITSEAKMVSFKDQFFSNAIQESYNTYNIPYYFVGKVIHFGYTNNVITRTFKYGHKESLLSIQKQNANYKVANRVTGVGSADNIPYYYPNDSEYGEVDVNVAWDKDLSGYDWDYDAYGDSELTLKDGDIVIVNPQKFAKNVGNDDKIISYAYQWRRGSIDGPVVKLSDIGVKMVNHDNNFPNAYFYFSKKIIGRKIPTSPNLLPSIYRETLGKERFYNAVNDTYLIPNSESFYEFSNPYIEGKPKEHIVTFEDIKPTIKGVNNSNGLRIDMFQEFAYDTNDNDEIDEEGNYVHPYFFAKLRKFDGSYGFNLFDHAIDEDEMTISMTSGSCGSCEFVIGVDESTQKNIVQVDDDGNLKRDDNGNVVRSGTPQDVQNDTMNNEVWIALKKDINTFGVVMPNAENNYKPSVNDTFVILHIDLPKAYILAAEDKLKEEIIQYMSLNNSEKFNFSISFSRIFFAENPDILEQLNENARIQIEYNSERYELYVSSFSYSMSNDKPIPEIRVELSDTLTIAQNALQNAISEVKDDILSNIGESNDFLKQGLRYFLRKDKDDTAKGVITFEKGIRSKDFVRGDLFGSGWSIYKDANGNTVVETDTIIARKGINASELIVNQETFQKGSNIFVKGGCTITKVEEVDGKYRCFYDNENGKRFSGFKVGDQARCQRYDSSYGLKIKYYWRLVIGIADDYVELSMTDFDGDGVPEEGDDIAQLGNRTDKTRQSAIVISPDNGGSVVVWAGIDSYNLSERNMCGMGVNPNSGRAYIYGYGDMFFGDRNLEKNFITYQIKDGDTEPTLTINADVQFGKDSTGLGNLTEFEDIKTDVDYLTNQIEREFTIWYFDDEPTLDNEPAVNWTTDELKAMHDQDLYFSDALARAWRFVNGNWVEVTDERTLAAIKLADGKRRVFVETPFTPYNIGDLWVQGETGDIMRCAVERLSGEYAESDWVKASKYTDDSALKTFLEGDYKKQLEEIQKQIDSRSETWYQAEDPSLSWDTEELKQLHIGDLWYSINDEQSFMWTGTEWIVQGVPDEVFDKIDGKAEIFVSKPTKYNRNDLWFLNEDITLDKAYKAGVIVVATAKSDVFNPLHWTKFDKYTDDTLAQEALKKAESFSDDLSGVLADMEIVKEQVDREFTIWYYDEEPTLYNEPAINWNTQALIDMHDQDIYFSDSLARAWRFVKGRWVEITDERTIAALNKVSDLEFIKEAFGENVMQGGVVISDLVGVQNADGEIEAFLNGGEFAKDDTHGKLILAGGIPDAGENLEERSRKSATRLYEDGHIVSKSADIEGTIRVGTMVHKTLYGEGGDLTGYSMAVGTQGVMSSFLLPEITDEDFIEVKVVWFVLSRLATTYYVMSKDGRSINYKSGGEFVSTTALNIEGDTFYKFFSVRGEWYVSTEPIYSV